MRHRHASSSKSFDKLPSYWRQHFNRELLRVAAFLLVAGLGVYFLSTSHAASYAASQEAENGTLGGNASVVSDASASGGKAVKFGTASSGGGGGVTFNTCSNPTHTLPTNPSNPQDGITLSGYYIDTDTWNFAKYPTSQQTVYVCNYNNWYVMVNVNDNANNGEVKTYPNAHVDYYSSAPRLTSFTNVSSTFAETAPGYGAWDMAYDIWINGQATELMIWNQSAGRQAHVPGIPIVGTVTLSGITYNIHKTGSYIAYDMTATHTSGNLNLLEIFNDMISRGLISNTATLGSIQYGAEICDTTGINTKFEINNFSITTN